MFLVDFARGSEIERISRIDEKKRKKQQEGTIKRANRRKRELEPSLGRSPEEFRGERKQSDKFGGERRVLITMDTRGVK